MWLPAKRGSTLSFRLCSEVSDLPEEPPTSSRDAKHEAKHPGLEWAYLEGGHPVIAVANDSTAVVADVAEGGRPNCTDTHKSL